MLIMELLLKHNIVDERRIKQIKSVNKMCEWIGSLRKTTDVISLLGQTPFVAKNIKSAESTMM